MHVYREVTVISCLENKYFPPVISSRLGSLKEILQFFQLRTKVPGDLCTLIAV